MAVSTRIVEHMEQQMNARWLWNGHPVKAIDGSSLSMPDTPANQVRWPQPERQAPGCGFPVIRIVALFSLATGALLALRQGPLGRSERALAAELFDELAAGDVLLADRGFCSYGDYAELLGRGVHAVMRQVQRLRVGGSLRIVKRLGKDDLLLQWQRGKAVPRGRTREQWEGVAQSLLIRQIRVRVAVPGFRSQEIVLLTTLLDHRRYRARDFGELYRRRWEAELNLRSLKTALSMDVLRCKSPAMIEKELLMAAIAYNLVRAVMTEAAARHKTHPSRLSFAATLAAVREWAARIARHRSAVTRRRLWRLMLSTLARDLLPQRPDRTEPRAVKRRKNAYPLLNKPRQQYIDTPHRNRYTRHVGQRAKG